MNLINPIANWRSIAALFSLLYTQRELTLEMTKREFSERYAGQVLGVVWGVAHPIILIGIYLFIFSYVFTTRSDAVGAGDSVNYAVYLLAGLVPWIGMVEALNKSTQVISSNANLVKQVIFPLEILPAKMVIATFATEIILVLCVMAYSAWQVQAIPWTYALVPLLLLLQFMQMLGIAMILSAAGAYMRDLKDLVQVFCLVNIYLMPVLYMTDSLPGVARWLIYLNPFTYQSLCFQDAIYHGAVTHYGAWGVFAVLSFSVLGMGCRLFAWLRVYFGNYL